MKNVPLKPAEIRYLSDIVKQDMLKTSDLDEKNRLAMLAITLNWYLNEPPCCVHDCDRPATVYYGPADQHFCLDCAPGQREVQA